MSTTANPYGFSHQQKIGGKPRAYTFTFPITASADGLTTYATSLAAGDPVGYTAANSRFIGRAVVPTDATSQPTLGTFINVKYTNVSGRDIMDTVWVANTPVKAGSLITATVDIDPMVIWQVQCNASLPGVSAVIGATGRNYNYVYGAPNLNTKTSTTSLNIADGGTEVWRSCLIVGLAEIVTNGHVNAWTDPFPDVLVVYNNHKLKQGTLGTS